MKKLFLFFLLTLVTQASQALVPQSCDPEKAPVIKTMNAVEAWALLEKIGFLAPQTVFNQAQWKMYQKLLDEGQKLGDPSVSVEIRQICDLYPQMADFDPILRKQKGPLKQYYIEIQYLYRTYGSKGNVLFETTVKLTGRIITGDGKNLSNGEIYQIYIDEVSSKLLRGYSTGGSSSAGGG